jgi:hypothetical protein
LNYEDIGNRFEETFSHKMLVGDEGWRQFVEDMVNAGREISRIARETW